jgi:hypothetical protein
VTGNIDYLGDDGQVTDTVNSSSQRAAYLTWCQDHGVAPAAQILGG